MSKLVEKRTVDMQIIGDWVEPASRVLDLGCGRGVLLDYLQQTKQARGLGVDLDFQKILGCVRRGVTAYQGDMEAFMRAFPDRFFDRVICSRTVQELADPAAVILEALRVGRELGGKDLDSNLPPQPRVPRAVHLPHPARAEGGENLVRTQLRARL